MKKCFPIITLLTLIGCQITGENTLEENKAYSFFIGTYTKGESKGIYKYMLKKDGKLEYIGLSVESDNPSFLAISKERKYLLAVNEINNDSGQGMVESFLIKEDNLQLISRRLSGGAHPCFVALNETGYVLTANYTGGNIGLLKLNKDGELTELLDVQQHIGRGSTEKQKSPHAHSAWFEPADNGIISVDLGTNELWFSQLDTTINKLIPSNPKKLKMAPGAGPRHLTFHPNKQWIYVVNELDCTVTHIYITKSGNYEKGSSVSTLPLDYNEQNTCADIHITSDGKFLYASNRGHNSIAIFEVNLSDGSLVPIGYQSTQGDGPRNFSLSPDERYLLVANQLTNNIVSFKRDNVTGLLKFLHQIEAPTPVCILF